MIIPSKIEIQNFLHTRIYNGLENAFHHSFSLGNLKKNFQGRYRVDTRTSNTDYKNTSYQDLTQTEMVTKYSRARFGVDRDNKGKIEAFFIITQSKNSLKAFKIEKNKWSYLRIKSGLATVKKNSSFEEFPIRDVVERIERGKDITVDKVPKAPFEMRYKQNEENKIKEFFQGYWSCMVETKSASHQNSRQKSPLLKKRVSLSTTNVQPRKSTTRAKTSTKIISTKKHSGKPENSGWSKTTYGFLIAAVAAFAFWFFTKKGEQAQGQNSERKKIQSPKSK